LSKTTLFTEPEGVFRLSTAARALSLPAQPWYVCNKNVSGGKYYPPFTDIVTINKNKGLDITYILNVVGTTVERIIN
jgi:hypothetical protein